MSHKHDEIQIRPQQVSVLKKLLSRYTGPKLRALFPLAQEKSKPALIKRITETYFPLGMTFQNVAELDLEYIQARNSRQWVVFKLGFELLEGEKRQPELDVVRLNQILDMELATFYSHFTSVHLFGGFTWIRINIDLKDTQTQDQTTGPLSSIWTTIYIICHPHGQHILVSGLAGSQKKFILHSLCGALKCQHIENANLHGSSFESLIDLIINQRSQGQYRDFRNGTLDLNPLDRSEPVPVQEGKKEEEGNLIDEDKAIRDERRSIIASTFGSSTEKQPQLETGKWKASVPKSRQKRKGTLLTEEDGLPMLSMSVTFDGPNILEGMKECIHYGIMQPPLPPHLEQLQGSAQNVFKCDTKTDRYY